MKHIASRSCVHPDKAKRVEGYELSSTVLIFLLALATTHIQGDLSSLFSKNKQEPNFSPKEKKKAAKKNPLLEKPYKELQAGYNTALAAKDYPTAVKYLDAMRVVCSDPEKARELLLELADLYFQQEEWTKAEKAYDEFLLLYPGGLQPDKRGASYAHYKAAQCGWKLTLTHDRDQTKTQETLKRTQEFITNYAQSEYKDQVVTIATQCREKLLASDVYIFDFYLNGKNYKAAQKRLDILSKEHIPQLSESQPVALELSIKLSQAQNNTESALRTQLELAQKFPDHDATKRLGIDIPTIKIELASLEKPTIDAAQNGELFAQFPDLELSKEIKQVVAVNDPAKRVMDGNAPIQGIRESKVKTTT